MMPLKVVRPISSIVLLLTPILSFSAVFSMTSTALIILPMVTVRRDVIMQSAAGMEVTAQDTRAPEGK